MSVHRPYHPLVQSAPFLRFYAGTALSDRGGYRLGTVSVMDRRSSEFSVAGWDVLRQVGDRVMELLAEWRDNSCQASDTASGGHTTMSAPTFAHHTIPPEVGLHAATPRLVGSDMRQAPPQSFTTPHLTVPGTSCLRGWGGHGLA